MGSGIHRIVEWFELESEKEFMEFVRLINTEFELAEWTRVLVN